MSISDPKPCTGVNNSWIYPNPPGQWPNPGQWPWPQLIPPNYPNVYITTDGTGDKTVEDKQTTEYTEIELKFDADHVLISDFVEWVQTLTTKPNKHIRVMGRDDYYSQGENVIRHRFPADGPGEITVKCRRDKNSTTNRVEVDLPLDPKATVPAVQRFMHYSGWKLECSLFKYAEIFHIKEYSGPEVTLVIYDINHIPAAGVPAKAPHRFIEVEVEKGPLTSVGLGINHLEQWKTRLKDAFKLTEPLNRSLYEIYTANHYKVVDEKNG